MRFILWLLFISILAFGCKPKQNGASTPKPSAPPAPTATGDEIQALNNLVISFYSTGAGANQKAVETIENFLNEFSAKSKNPVPYSKIAWGREGEVDFCISLTGLDGDERKSFLDNLRSLVKQFELIHFLENHPCRQLK
jgi:hypothetical protein